MLQDIRDSASSWVAYIIIGLLILSFAMWGIQEYFGGGAGAPVATINGNDITLPAFNQQVQQRKQTLAIHSRCQLRSSNIQMKALCANKLLKTWCVPSYYAKK